MNARKEKHRENSSERRLKIAIVSKADRSGGGASRVAADLADLLNEAGHTAHHWLLHRRGRAEAHVRDLYGERFSKAFRLVNAISRSVGTAELFPVELSVLGRRARREGYDLVHFHDLTSAVSPLTVLALSKRWPTFWTFHDCSPFTGGCLYPMDCTRYLTRCGACPQRGDWPLQSRFDRTGFMQDVRRVTHRFGSVHALSPSNWMADRAMESGVVPRRPEVIPNGVDTKRFRPRNRAELKRMLEIDPERTVLLLAAGDVEDARKGTRQAIEALNAIREKRPHLIVVGHAGNALCEALRGFDVLFAGWVSSDEFKSRLFAASDAYLFCSLADNLPLTVLETMASATPTLGFATGGIPEMIEHERTGYLVRPGDISGLVSGLEKALQGGGRLAKWGEAARTRAVEHFSNELFLENHLRYYRKIIGER